MLDLNKLSHQLQQASFEWQFDSDALNQRLHKALATWKMACQQDFLLVDKLLTAPDDLPWAMARPLEPLNMVKPLPERSPVHMVVATDGSQIAPSRHEVSPCYLINVGKIAYVYGKAEAPLQESEPFLYFREKDLYTQVRRQYIGISEQLIGIERTLMEFHELAGLCGLARKKGYPAIAMVDGGLLSIAKELGELPAALQEPLLKRFRQSLDQMQASGIPVCAYISLSRRTEVVNFLRLQLCPFTEAHCNKYCQEGEEVCNGLMPLPDRDLWSRLLQPGQRSPLFASTVKGLAELEAHALCFFYLHTGYEVARIEIPRWLADRPADLEQLHGLIYEQVQKGFGYPIALAEAHNRAVIKSSDRGQFYAMLSRKLIGAGRHVSLSNKELKKRGGIV